MMSSKEEKIRSFDPNGVSTGQNLFGLPFNENESDIIVLPVPWEVTVSFRSGTAQAPRAILEASRQVDLYDGDLPDAWMRGIFMRKTDKRIFSMGRSLRKKVVEYLEDLEHNKRKKGKKILKEVNKGGEILRDWVKKETGAIIQKKKLPFLLGGDHSTPLGFMEACAEHYSDFGILQIDAHCDLRNAYEGFQYSHASIMFNALKIPQVKKLVQVGIRDYCKEEMDVVADSKDRVMVFFDSQMKREMYSGTNWKNICDDIVKLLPENVYISFDIDGLDPKLCPQTGTPVPGGLEYEQAVYLMNTLVDSGRKIIGCDLNEIATDKKNGKDEYNTSWDANVGARLLYKMSNLMGASQKFSKTMMPAQPVKKMRLEYQDKETAD